MAKSILLTEKFGKRLGHFGPTELFDSEKSPNLLGHSGQAEQSFLVVKKNEKSDLATLIQHRDHTFQLI